MHAMSLHMSCSFLATSWTPHYREEEAEGLRAGRLLAHSLPPSEGTCVQIKEVLTPDSKGF